MLTNKLIYSHLKIFSALTFNDLTKYGFNLEVVVEEGDCDGPGNSTSPGKIRCCHCHCCCRETEGDNLEISPLDVMQIADVPPWP